MYEDYIVILVWVILGLIAAYIYNQKGRSAAVGCMGGFILGPIGILLALLTRPNLKKCPYCAEYIKPEAVVCKHCGKELVEPA
jgi:hypothetical protein